MEENEEDSEVALIVEKGSVTPAITARSKSRASKTIKDTTKIESKGELLICEK